ncbi:MAG: hypothetical protein ACYC4Q_08035 [Victivallaceae bacterium]
MKELEFRLPAPDSPGYLRRAKLSLEFRQKMSSGNAGPETIDALVDFLLQFVEQPEDRNEARESLFDATEEQFLQLLDVVAGNVKENPTPAQPKNDQ